MKYLICTNVCNKPQSLSYKIKLQNILYDDINAHLLVTCLLSICHCFRNSCTCVQKLIPPYSRFNSGIVKEAVCKLKYKWINAV